MNKDKKQYAVFIDIDGTLMGESKAALEENLGVIQKLRSLGHKVFISTGRANSYIPKFLEIEKNFDGMITAAGGYVKIGASEIAKKLMPYDVVKVLCRYFAEHNVPGALEGEEHMYFFGEMCFSEDDWIKLDKDSAEEIINEDTPIIKFTIDGKIPAEISEILGPEYTIIQHPDYGEIVMKGYSKAVGVEIVLSELGLPREQSVAIGDSLNDLEMIEYAGIGVAMGNAVDEVKAVADIIAGDVDDAGVAEALRSIFELRRA